MAPLPIKFTEICQLTQLPNAGIQVRAVVFAIDAGSSGNGVLRLTQTTASINRIQLVYLGIRPLHLRTPEGG